MFSSLKRNWWPIVVIAQAVLGLAAAGMTVVQLTTDSASEHAGFRVALATISLLASALLFVGLWLLGRNRQAGSWLILVGSIPTVPTLLALNPVSLLAVATIAGGLWTGNLTFMRQTADIDPALPEGPPIPSRGRAWYRWLIAAVCFLAAGYAVLIVFPDGLEDPELDTVRWLAWVLSWGAAAASAAVGVALGLAHLIARHRTRPAENVTTT